MKLLRQDHRAVAEAIEEFASAERDEKQAIARHICKMLIVHSQIEEELLYPAARDVLDADDAHLIAEAHVEHASVKDLIRQIEDREQLDEQYEAKVQVLGEYVKHHVAEEETELFPRLERTPLDLQSLGERLEERKRELMGEPRSGERPDTMAGQEAMPPGMANGTAYNRAHRSSSAHARRR
ncbi:MAG TPA: hemerythrin domain-containing protein [Steroidobacteraceae bacterium]|nr:hemerythrin domain-containing protein [Steroidobacteraceae bacterium]